MIVIVIVIVRRVISFTIASLASLLPVDTSDPATQSRTAVATVFFLKLLGPLLCSGPQLLESLDLSIPKKAMPALGFSLAVVAKLLQALAAGTRYDPMSHMASFNDFLDANAEKMHQFAAAVLVRAGTLSRSRSRSRPHTHLSLIVRTSEVRRRANSLIARAHALGQRRCAKLPRAATPRIGRALELPPHLRAYQALDTRHHVAVRRVRLPHVGRHADSPACRSHGRR
mgnify:CR=1 FL=1